MSYRDMIDLRLHNAKSEHCINIDSPPEKTLR